jgi:hypothetical protein
LTTRISRAVRVLLLAFIGTALALLVPVPASASAGAGGYDGMSPVSTGCSRDAVTIDRKALGGATLLLRYSPSCRTVWATIRGAARRTQDQAGGAAVIHRDQDDTTRRCHTGTGRSCHTAMLNDRGYTSHATGTNDVGWTIHRARTISY